VPSDSSLQFSSTNCLMDPVRRTELQCSGNTTTLCPNHLSANHHYTRHSLKHKYTVYSTEMPYRIPGRFGKGTKHHWHVSSNMCTHICIAGAQMRSTRQTNRTGRRAADPLGNPFAVRPSSFFVGLPFWLDEPSGLRHGYLELHQPNQMTS
jgi:hypothetical protein